MKKWLSLCSLVCATSFARNPDTSALLEKVERDVPTYTHMCTHLVNNFTRNSEVIDCSIKFEENAETSLLEKVYVSVRVNPDELKKKRREYESKAEAVVGILSSHAKRRIKRTMNKELSLEKLVPHYKRWVHSAVCKAFPEVAPGDIEVEVTTK